MAEYICTKCHYVGDPKTRKRGSKALEKFSWVIFPIGLPYVFWRMLTKLKSCRHCGDSFVVSVNSKEGKRLLALEQAALGPAAVLKSKEAPPKVEPVKPIPKPPLPNQDPNEW